nr:hypothetical protein [Tanacetum cinerariifolium]
MILESVEHGPLIQPMLEENGVIRTKKYVELSAAEKIQADCDMKSTNIILQVLPADIYSLERKCKLYDAFDKFTYIKGETLHKYYLRFTQLINDMNIYNMIIEQFQVNTKFLNSLPPEWSKFVTVVKLVKGLAVPVFSLRDDPIACLNKAIAFLTVVASSRQRLLNVTTIKVKDIWLGNTLSLSDQGMQHGIRRKQCWLKLKKLDKILDEEQLTFLADPGVPDGQAVQTIIPNNAAFQTEDLDTYDSDCDDLLNAQAVLMANISNYGSDVILEGGNPCAFTPFDERLKSKWQKDLEFELRL